jgi:two-component system, NarL family, sensor kinase
LKAARRQPATRPAPALELTQLRGRVAESEETLRAIRSGEVDAVVQGDRVFTLEGAEHAYRVLIESMNEGALTLAADTTILYANHCFARMVKSPLEQVIGGSLQRFLSVDDRATLRPLLKQSAKAGTKIQVVLQAEDGSKMAAQVSIRPLEDQGPSGATIGIVVTDMTEARRMEELLRALTQRVVQVQEAERGRVALELHDNITQLLCAVLSRSQALADQLPEHEGAAKQEAIKLRDLLGKTAEEVERISRNLRPSVLEHLGLVAVLSDTSREFASRTNVRLKLACAELVTRLPADTELTLYRILQESLKNVEKHARASTVRVSLKQKGAAIQLVITDDGIGFDPDHHAISRKEKIGLGLLSMRERAAYVGGILKIKTGLRAGTEVEVSVPLTPGGPMEN